MTRHFMLILTLFVSLQALAFGVYLPAVTEPVQGSAVPPVKSTEVPDPEKDADPVLLPLPELYCPKKFTSIVVKASAGMMALCEAGHSVHTYRVAIGSGGLGKRTQGDRKTPAGVYELGTPRPSERFGTFIPVGYPTKLQKATGYSGADVGVHGPDKDFESLGLITVMMNWTAGCIAVAYYTEISEIKNWVNTKHPVFIQIIQ